MVICAKAAEPIEMPFGLCAQMCRRNVLYGGPEVLKDVAMATNFGTKLIANNWLCVDEYDSH